MRESREEWAAPGRHGPLAQPVALVRSLNAGGAHGLEPEGLLRAAGVEVGETLDVSDLDHQSPLGPSWRDRGFGAAVAAGGDGTIGAVVSHLSGTALPLGILPLGTSNDTARSLGVPLDPVQAAQTIAAGTAIEVDAGQALPATTEPLGTEGASAATTEDEALAHRQRAAYGATFLHALTLGLNVEFARLATDLVRRQQWGRLTYAAAAIEAIVQFRPVPLTLRFAGVRALSPAGEQPDADGSLTVTHTVAQIAVVNLPVFGGAMNLRVPQVEAHDRLLDFLLIEAFELSMLTTLVEGWISTLRRFAESTGAPGEVMGAGMARAAPQQMSEGFALPGIRRYRAQSAVIETPEPLGVTLDGEIRSRTPVLVRVSPAPVPVLLPASVRA